MFIQRLNHEGGAVSTEYAILGGFILVAIGATVVFFAGRLDVIWGDAVERLINAL